MARRKNRFLALLLAVSATPAPNPVGAEVEPAVHERVAVQLVQVNFLATDRGGNPVLDLTAQDIEVLENGRRQRVAFLESYDAGSAGAARSPSPPGAPIGPSSPTTRPSPGRWIVLLLDAATSSPRTRVTSLAAIQEFLQKSLTPHDRAALVLFDGKVRLLQTFTQNHALLQQAASMAEGQLLHTGDDRTRALRSLIEGVESCRATPTTGCVQRSVNEYEDARLREAQDLLFALTTITRSLTPIPDIKTVVLFSDGFSRTPFSDGFDAVRATLGFPLAQQLTSYAGDKIDRALSDFAGAAAQARVSVFTIFPGGGAGRSAVSAERGITSTARNAEDVDVYRRSEQNFSAGLSELARRSGGHHTQGNDALAQLNRIWRLSGGLYTAGYYLTDVRPGRKPLDVRVRSLRKGVVIESRREIPPLDAHGDLRGTLTAQGDPCDGSDGRRAAAVRLSVDRRLLEFVGSKTLTASLSVYLSIVDADSGSQLYGDYRLLQIERSTKDTAPPEAEAIDPGLEMTLRVPCRALLVRAVVVDAQSGARGEFSADLPRP
jgi:VWFA-related protein